MKTVTFIRHMDAGESSDRADTARRELLLAQLVAHALFQAADRHCEPNGTEP